MRTLAIIGAGFCGTVAAIEFINVCNVPTKLIMIEQTGTFGPGVAYGNQSRNHVLNVPAGNMSALQDQPDSFLEYCQRNNLGTSSGDFVPRREYGRYLSALLDSAISSCSAILVIERIHAEAIEIKETSAGASVRLSDDRCMNADHVLLACGNFPPSTPKPFTSIKNHPGYMDAPWGLPPLKSRTIRPSDSILLIGSGLTALDMIGRLAEEGHEGHVTALSRRGLQPQVHRGHSRYTALHSKVTREAICSVEATALTYVKIVRQLIADSPDADWRDIIAALRPCTAELWYRLPYKEKLRFLRHVKPYWESHRHRAAPEANEFLKYLKASGRFTLVKGRLITATVTDDQVVCQILNTANRSTVVSAFDVVINCTGPNTSVTSAESPLVQQLLKDGIIVADALGLGILLDTDFSVVTSKRTTVKWLSYVGPMLKSMFWEATAVPELRQHVRTHAARLAKQISHGAGEVNSH
ncbi:FAD/NAD(P)-binding protein [Pseudomonas alliivorans]|nr:FAD/NAD(P)-binding protein [Pseudomonas alliivorans]MEE4710923.1 FAD/NAD(P)-binding protein [Pseudomonas alliivorans]MEE4724470.1 FAD/NAD(P)-binding protein [Pseudomonas alliivorans]MEE4766669.1 FAD/NAD(P)-binding protein [Pseudomonas alliivorans]